MLQDVTHQVQAEVTEEQRARKNYAVRSFFISEGLNTEELIILLGLNS